MQWQPIETAPKDGTWILIFRSTPHTNMELGCALVYWDDHFTCWHDGEYHSDHYDPSHWVPLPEPPPKEVQ